MGSAVVSSDRLVCTYRGVAMVLGMFVFLALGSGTGYVTLLAISGKVKDSTTQQPMTPLFGLVFGVASAACLFLFFWAALCLMNESITLEGDKILWRDKLARARVECTIHDVLPFSFVATERFSGSDPRVSTMVYRVGTRMGSIKFDGNISNSDVLAARLRTISDGPVGPAQSGAPSSHWTNDPLSEPNPGDMPTR